MQIERSVLCVGLSLLLLSTPLYADWKRDYDRGLQAVRAQNWGEAEQRFREALRDEGEPEVKKRFEGMRFDTYVPHFYAGLAAYRQGACERAIEYWQHGPTNSVLADRKLADLRTQQQRGLSDCQTRLAQQTTPTPTATKPAASQPAPTTSVSQPEPKPTPPPSRPAPVAVTPKPAPPTAAPAARRSAAPAVLRSALENYLAGRYRDVLRLDPAAAGDAMSRAHVYLLRAAAGYTLSEQAGGDRELSDAAKQDVRAARSSQSSLSPDAMLFSPRFRDFWQDAR